MDSSQAFTFRANSKKLAAEENYNLDEEKGKLVTRVCESIIVAKETTDWDSTLAQVVENLDALADLDISEKVLEVGANHQLDDLSSAILYHSTKIQV